MNIMRKSEKKVQTKQKKIREITVQRKKYSVKIVNSSFEQHKNAKKSMLFFVLFFMQGQLLFDEIYSCFHSKVEICICKINAIIFFKSRHQTIRMVFTESCLQENIEQTSMSMT